MVSAVLGCFNQTCNQVEDVRDSSIIGNATRIKIADRQCESIRRVVNNDTDVSSNGVR